jgi:anti-sigma regulatory factor (Ser/Thr protein kinase)
MQKQFSRSLQTLPQVMEVVSSFCQQHGAAGGSSFAISFAVEEIFTNMVKYNPDGPLEVSLSFEKNKTHLVVTLEDEQDHDFDPDKAPDPDFDEAMANRKPGGLGLYLVRKMVQKVDYRRQEKKNIVTLTHPLE